MLVFKWEVGAVVDLSSCLFFEQSDIDGRAYYTFEFIAQAPNYKRHALSVITIGNGMNSLITKAETKMAHHKILIAKY